MDKNFIDNIINNVFDKFKKLSPALIVASIVSGCILFLPKNILVILGLFELPLYIRTVIGLIFLFSSTLIITLVGMWFAKRVNKKIKYFLLRKNCKKRFCNLSEGYKEILIELLNTDNKTMQMSMVSGDTIYLVQNGFICNCQGILLPTDIVEHIAYYVPQPWLIDLFQNERSLFTLNRKD